MIVLKQGQVRVVLVCVLICLGLLMMAALHLDTRSSAAQACDCPEEKQAPVAAASKLEPATGHKLCLIVPFKESSKSCDYIAMHDVDLLPKDPKLLYSFPENGPLHIASPELHPKYDYPTFIGGILLISRKHYNQLDGMSNKYWGWGLEDDEFFVRVRQANLPIQRPKGIRSGRSGAFTHVHSAKKRQRDNAKCYNQRNATRRRDKQTGLSTVFYKVSAKRHLTIDTVPVTLLDIHLECDKGMTPWCNCTGAPPDTNKPDRSRDEDVVVPLIPKKQRPQKKF